MTTIEKPSRKKQAQLALSLSEDHKQRIEQAAALTGQTLDSFAATELVRRADEILENQEVRRLSNRDHDIFLALLDADPDLTEAAKNAAARFNKGHWVGEAYRFQAPAHASKNGDASDE